MVDELVLRSTFRAPQAAVFERVRDVEGYDRYCRYVESVRRAGDGTVGTEYTVRLAWRRATYAARVRLTELEPPARISWEVVAGGEAAGEWRLEDRVEATAVTFRVRYDPDSGEAGLSLPAFVPTSVLFELLRPVAEREADRIAERLAADLEVAPRDPGVRIDHRRDAG